MKKGFTMIDNNFLEAVMASDLNATEIKVLLAIARYSYGYQRGECTLAVDYITKICGRSKRMVLKALKSLCERHYVIKKKVEGKNILSYALDYTCLGEQRCTEEVQSSSSALVKNSSPYKYNNINKNYIYKSRNDFNVPTPKATAFSNFTPRGDIDYRRLEMDALRRKLMRAKE